MICIKLRLAAGIEKSRGMCYNNLSVFQRRGKRGKDMYKIMIAEDDKALAKALHKAVSAWDYEVRCAERLDDIMGEFREFSPQLVLLDLTLPYHNGFYWCSEIRKISKVPIVFLSSAAVRSGIHTLHSCLRSSCTHSSQSTSLKVSHWAELRHNFY